MISEKQYVPILKGKDGEFSALAKLPSEQKERIVPIIDLVPNPSKKFNDHLKDILGYVKKKWEQHRLFYIDGHMIQDYDYLSTGIYSMKYIFSELHKDNFNVIPVISNATGFEYNEQIKRILRIDNKGVCVRILRKAINDVNNELEQILSFLEMDSSSVDLVFDLRSLKDLSVDKIYEWCVKTINELSNISNWRSLVLSGGNFPVDLTELKPDQIHLVPRNEWEVWKKLAERNEIERLPSYSDYAISHPQMSEYGPGIPNASASIRYTHESDFYVYRGRGTRQHHFEQFFELAEALVNSSEYYSKEHCAGDKFILKCAKEKKKPGSLRTWRWVGTNHHLTVVANQLLQFFRDLSASRTS